MISEQFQLHKVQRLINTNGVLYNFTRHSKNEYGEPSEGSPENISVKGMYHGTAGYLSLTFSDSTTIRKQISPMILCTWEDAKALKQGDQLILHKKLYQVSGVVDIAELQLIADICLEEVQK